jgi:hypothetical protein
MIAAPVQCDVDGIPKGSHYLTSYAASGTDASALARCSARYADLLAHRDWIAREVLADEIDLRGGLKELAIVKAEPGAYGLVADEL